MDITFESFAKLIYRLSHPPQARSRENRTFTPADIFTSWLNHLDRPLPPGSGKHVLRILFPHEGCRRRYGMKEMKLACELERILRIKGLSRWDSAGSPGGGSGCLGLEVQRVCKERTTSRVSSLTLAEIDLRLDQLASYSPFSQLEVPPCDPPSQTDILSHLFRDSNLSSYASGLLIQIILQDIRPFLDPLPKLALRNATSLLRMKSTHGPPQLDLLSAMRAWDPRMADMFVDGKGDLDWYSEAQAIFRAQLGLLNALALLGFAHARLKPQWARRLERTNLMNPDFIADSLHHFYLLHSSLEAGRPLPVNTSILERLVYHSQSSDGTRTNAWKGDSEPNFEQREEDQALAALGQKLTWNLCHDEQMSIFAATTVAMTYVASGLEELTREIADLVGETSLAGLDRARERRA
ncbi:hypothetical protein BD324DRAFT_654306 [Kockovaella imperatae]|uniref:Uncharacterized protein n=1 Tax=Kockovaella imperatae TaxID=4999 RepID=A0A1Y1U5C5_9TREE|nr:hypothetical protein BD324DRAFT_654306 [Kockovaella imperatae]ORX33230.1 hypothetical protein BD324DRAFT_654306 [Kockovaella imperatae]